jgi:hypothetical protein
VAVVQISKIQHRRGKVTGSGVPQLASAEIGWAVDTQQLYIGNGAVSEGAPYVGNTEILTEHSNLFTLLNQYEYKGTTDAAKKTGEFVNSPTTRSIQQRLDDFVSVKSFGAKGTGDVDDTEALQRAIDELFINVSDKDDPRSRVALKIDAGEYKITNTLYIPPYANLIGDGKNKTIIKLHPNPNEVTPIAKPMVATVDGRSLAGTYITYSNIQNATRPQNITISGITFEVDSLVTTHDAIAKLDCMTESLIHNCKFKNHWDKLDGFTSQSGIHIRGLGATTSEHVIIDDCEFERLDVAIHSDHDVRSFNIANSYFHFLQVGIQLGKNSVGTGAQSQGPRHFKIAHNTFDKINDFGIAVYKKTTAPQTSPYGHTSVGNNFLDVANNMNGQNSPQTSVIKFEETLCESIGDNFEREAFINTSNLLETPFKPNVDGYHQTKSRVNSTEISERDSFGTFTKIPFTKDKTAYVDYLLVKDATKATTRSGRLTIAVRDGSNISVTDSYTHTGSEDGGVDFTAILDDLDSTVGSETVKIQYRNPIGNGNGTLTYSITYFA